MRYIGATRPVQRLAVIKTTIGSHQRVLADEQFRRGDVSTDYVAQLAARDAMAGAASG